MPIWQRSTPKSTAIALASDSGTEASSSSSESSSSQRESAWEREKSASMSSLSCVSGRRPALARPPLRKASAAVSNASFQVSPLGSRARPSGHPFSRVLTSPEFLLGNSREGSNFETASARGGCAGKPRVESSGGDVMRLLVIGSPQVGKSSLINRYRATITNNSKWPAAPVGICGYCGTTTVEPFPNHPVRPSWLCIDTPGRIYDSSNVLLLEKLFAGIRWKTKLAGRGAVRLEDVKNIPTVPENKAHQCIIVVPAVDLIVDEGWMMSVIQFKNRYSFAPDADGVVMYLRNLVCTIRSLLYDASPFVVITKMDLVGGAGNTAARQAITSLLTQCIPVNRIFFCACPGDESLHETRRPLSLDRDTYESFVSLHETLCLTFRWKMSVEESL